MAIFNSYVSHYQMVSTINHSRYSQPAAQHHPCESQGLPGENPTGLKWPGVRDSVPLRWALDAQIGSNWWKAQDIQKGHCHSEQGYVSEDGRSHQDLDGLFPTLWEETESTVVNNICRPPGHIQKSSICGKQIVHIGFTTVLSNLIFYQTFPKKVKKQEKPRIPQGNSHWHHETLHSPLPSPPFTANNFSIIFWPICRKCLLSWWHQGTHFRWVQVETLVLSYISTEITGTYGSDVHIPQIWYFMLVHLGASSFNTFGCNTPVGDVVHRCPVISTSCAVTPSTEKTCGYGKAAAGWVAQKCDSSAGFGQA